MKFLFYCNFGEKGGLFYSLDYLNVNDNLLVKVIVVEIEIFDFVLDENGDFVYCLVCLFDQFCSLYLNDQVVMVVNGGVMLFDFLVILKVCGYGNEGDGVLYVYLLLFGYFEMDKIKMKQGEDGFNVNYFEFDKGEMVGILIQLIGFYYNLYFVGDIIL